MKHNNPSLNTGRAQADAKRYKVSWKSDSAHEIIGDLANNWWNDPARLFSFFGKAGVFQSDPVEVKTVGIYYFRMGIGGAERVTASLIELWVSMGLRVVLFTEEPEQEGDYSFDSNVKRIVLPSMFEVKKENYVFRAKVLQDALIEQKVDALVYGQWISHLLPWDMLVCKAQEIPFIPFAHSSFRSLLCEGDELDYQQTIVYRYVDGIVVLSETDERFWRMFNPRVWRTINPLTILPDKDTRSDLSGKTILWLGRLSEHDKRPSEALRIMQYVHKRVPEAKLLLIGPSVDDWTTKNLFQLTKDLGVTDCVTFAGATEDPEPYLEQARVFLLTSCYEGYCLALAEAKAKGLPVVSYELPYLTLTRGDCGVQMVPQEDHEAAADVLVKLLEDSQLCKNQGDAAFAQISALAKFDFVGLWSDIFASLAAGSVSREPLLEEDLLFDALTEAEMDSIGKLQDRINYACGQRDEAARKLDAALAKCEELENSTTFKVGRALTAVPRKIKDFRYRIRT